MQLDVFIVAVKKAGKLTDLQKKVDRGQTSGDSLRNFGISFESRPILPYLDRLCLEKTRLDVECQYTCFLKARTYTRRSRKKNWLPWQTRTAKRRQGLHLKPIEHKARSFYRHEDCYWRIRSLLLNIYDVAFSCQHFL